MKSSSGDKLRVEDLRLLIQLHSHKYHFLDEPEISDEEYDSLFQELIYLEKTNDALCPPNPKLLDNALLISLVTPLFGV